MKVLSLSKSRVLIFQIELMFLNYTKLKFNFYMSNFNTNFVPESKICYFKIVI